MGVVIPMEAHALLGRHVLTSQHRPSFACFVSLNRFGNVLTFAICIGNGNGTAAPPRASAAMSVLNPQDKSPIRKVVWTIETQVEVGEDQLVYVTGDPTQLGCWEPHLAIPMSPPSHSQPNLWTANAHLQIASSAGGCFKYNYFIKNHNAISWRPGPEFSLSVPLPDTPQTTIVVRDSWLDSASNSALTHSFFEEDPYLHTQLQQPPCISIPIHQTAEQNETENHLRTDPSHHVFPRSKDQLCSNNARASDAFLCQSYQPVEEPWLPQSPSFSAVSEEDNIRPIASGTNDSMHIDEENFEDTENLPLQGDDSISTLILINSSLCTMQRIAVLEDGHLVELLLEPVKTNVQCDSVYLGVVTKLVPHMGGAFVNIGSSRPSLMDIKQNREPFIFPPFRKGAIRPDVNGALVEAIEEHLGMIGNNHAPMDSEIIDEMSGVVDDEGNETEDELDDASEIFVQDVNESIVDHGEVEADYEETTMAFSGYSQMHNLQDIRDSGHAVCDKNKWGQVQKGTKVIVQVVKEGLGTKGPTLTAYPKLRSRFWVMITRCDRIGVSKKISGIERTRLKVIAKTLQPPGFGLTVRTVAAGHTLEELQKDLEGLLSTWKNITEHAKSASLAADEGVEGAVPVILHEAMAQTLSVVQDYFNEKVERMVVDSARTFHEVTNYLQDIAPDLFGRVELYKKRIPLFDEFNIEEEIDNILSKRVALANGGSLVIEQTEALVSIDVNGGHVMFGQGNSQEKAVLDVNLAAAKQIARELRLRDIGGIIVVDFIDMTDESNKRLVYEEVKKAVERDRSMVKVSELSKHGLMEITRKRVRPSVTFMISEPCSCCHATGRVEALETSFSKIEQEISRLLATMYQKAVPGNPKLWPKFVLRVDHHMCEYLTSGKRTRLALLSSSLKVWILLKVARGFGRGAFEVKPFAQDKEESSENRHQVTIPVLRQKESKSSNPSKKVTLIPVKKWKTGGRQ